MVGRVARATPPLKRVLAERDEARASARRNEARAALLEEELAASARGDDGLDYVFVVTYGRSGSTLVQGILSSIPGYLIRGENGDALYELFRFHRRLENERVRRAKAEPLPPTHAWYGVDRYPTERAIEQLRTLALTTVLRPASDTRVVGFKEIRWWHDDWREYLGFLREVFPGARFVLNTRDHDDVAASFFWAKDAAAHDKLDTYEAILDEVAEVLGPDHAYRLHYDDYVADLELLRGLFRWLGEDFDLDRVRAVMARKHSF